MFAHVNRIRSYLTEMPSGKEKATRNKPPNPGRPIAFGENLRARLAALEMPMSQFVAAVAEKSEKPISDETADNWWNGRNVPRTDYREAVCEVLKVPSFDLLLNSAYHRVPETDARHAAAMEAITTVAETAATPDSLIASDFHELLRSPDGPYVKMAVTLLKRALQRGR